MTASKTILAKMQQAKDSGGQPRPTAPADGRMIRQDERIFLAMEDATLILNANSSPIEFLASSGELESGADDKGMGGARFHAAIRFRELVHGAQVVQLRSINLASARGAGGALDITGYQLDCQKILGRLKHGIEDVWIYPMLESVVVMDEWLDLVPVSRKLDKKGVKRKQRLKTIRALHYGLDKVGHSLGFMNTAAFMRRWPQSGPEMPPSVHHHIRATKA